MHPVKFEYQLDSYKITRSDTIKDLGVTFDQKLTFNDHISAVAKESYRRLGFVLRNSGDFKGAHVIRIIFGALVRSKLEASSCVWHPHEQSYTLMLEKVQKAFLRYLYKRVYGYYPFLYPTNFLLGCLDYNSLEVRREHSQMLFMCKVLHGKIDAPNLHNSLLRLNAPDPNGLQPRRGGCHKLFSLPPARTVAHTVSPIPRTLRALNNLLAMAPDCDLFADEWKSIVSICLEFCEKKARNVNEECEFDE